MNRPPRSRIVMNVLLLTLVCSHVVGFTFTLPLEIYYSQVVEGIRVASGYGPPTFSAIQWGVEYGLKVSGREDIEIDYIVFDSEFLISRAVQFLIETSEQGHTLIGGNEYSDLLTVTGQAGSVYGVAQLSSLASSSALSDKTKYPYVSRNCAADPLTTGGTASMIAHLRDQFGRGWDKVAILTSSEGYALSMARSLIPRLQKLNIEVVTYQQFVVEAEQVSVEMREIQRSGARVIVVFTVDKYNLVLEEGRKLGLIDDHHAWFVGSYSSISTGYYTYPNGTYDDQTLANLRGHIGCTDYFDRKGPAYEDLVAQWNAADRIGGELTSYLALTYDMGYTVALSVIQAHDEGLFDGGKQPHPAEWSRIIRGLKFEGASGPVTFLENGDRITPTAIVNFRPELVSWVDVGYWTDEEGLVLDQSNPVIWYDNTTEVPDLDIRPPVTYWSCEDAKKKEDPTGKTVRIDKPDRDGAKNIEEHYHCDNFIDCDNMSDESHDCDGNFVTVFIVFGVITGILVLLSCCLIPFVIVFGYCIRRKRIRASSPPFLILICLSCIVGFASTFAWYGKPHPVACGFQPWLLGLSIVSLISALSAKTWRLWRLFSVHTKRGVVISDLHLLLLYSLLMLPALVILIVWTIVSTPTADMERRDGEHHYVCTTGGFTGKPGGLVFFFILVGYEALVVVFAAFLSIATRNVPSFFNESKLIAISIYNLGLLAVVVIPVFMVLQEFNPFAAWIIRTVAILYAFAATLFLQFAPKLVGLLIIDRGRDIGLNNVSLGKTNKVAGFVATSSESMEGATTTSSYPHTNSVQ